jgi:hypothetical protein
VAAAELLALTTVLPREPKEGDTRRLNKVFRAGYIFVFDKDPQHYKLNCDVTMDIEEMYDGRDWCLKHYYTDTTRPITPKFTRWRRLKLWLFGPSLPVARALK